MNLKSLAIVLGTVSGLAGAAAAQSAETARIRGTVVSLECGHWVSRAPGFEPILETWLASPQRR